ncbi:MAG: hypothetical protein QMD92_08110 [bacterium]|nr:hypothetical protein [bacterium]
MLVRKQLIYELIEMRSKLFNNFVMFFVCLFISQSVAISQEYQDSSDYKNFIDKGHWIGTGLGFQTNGGPLSERWYFNPMYEYRFANVFSIPIEFHLFRDRIIKDKKYLMNQFFLSASLKCRFYLKRNKGMNIFIAGGINTAPWPQMLSFYYSLGNEIFINDSFSIISNFKRTTIEDTDYFISIGFNFKFAKEMRRWL